MMLTFWDVEACRLEIERSARKGTGALLWPAASNRVGMTGMADPHWETARRTEGPRAAVTHIGGRTVRRRGDGEDHQSMPDRRARRQDQAKHGNNGRAIDGRDLTGRVPLATRDMNSWEVASGAGLVPI